VLSRGIIGKSAPILAEITIRKSQGEIFGFDHGAGHPLLFLDDANAPNCQKNNWFSDLGNYSEWPKVAGAVIQAKFSALVCDLKNRIYMRSYYIQPMFSKV
jgi:hypothetical protein